MQQIEILHTKQGCGFTAKPTTTTLAGVEFDNKKIAYQNPDGVIYSAEDEQTLVKTLKSEEHTIRVEILRKE